MSFRHSLGFYGLIYRESLVICYLDEHSLSKNRDVFRLWFLLTSVDSLVKNLGFYSAVVEGQSCSFSQKI